MNPARGMNSGRRLATAGVVLLLVASALAQFDGRRDRRETYQRSAFPTWSVTPGFDADVFTFARVQWTSRTGRRSQTWQTDFPDSDLNLSFRLQELTALKVAPDPKLVRLTDPELFNFPFLFMSGVGGLILEPNEVEPLRLYLDSGGFLMVDDFWGEAEWNTFYGEMKRVFPGREPVDLPFEHPIFHHPMPLQERPQIPNVYFATRNRSSGVTWEQPDSREPNYRAILDDAGRIMVMICHNTDLGDGWEEEGTDPWYFATFSEPKAYPLGINILFHAMTH